MDKFRGQRVDSGEWIYGGSVITFDDNGVKTYYMPVLGEKCTADHEDVTDNILSIKGNFYLVENVCEYIDLTDKENKEIYKGDILQDEQGIKYIVRFGEFIIIEYDERQYGYYAEEIAKKEYEIGLTGNFPLFKLGCAQSGVIGNIYDNPDLLEVLNETSKI